MLEARYTACNEEPTWKCRPRDDDSIQKADIVCSPCLLALSTDRCLFFHNGIGLHTRIYHARVLHMPSSSDGHTARHLVIQLAGVEPEFLSQTLIRMRLR